MSTAAVEGGGLSPRARFAWLDIARGLALVAMAVYHFVWDLALFGLVEPWTPFEPHWVLLARATAGSFLFLVGIGLVLGHARGIRWRPFLRRLALIAGAAMLITIGTWIATPDAFIFFGILHMIAVGSVVGLLLVRAPPWVSWAAALAVLLIGMRVALPFFDEPVWWWSGLGTQPIRSNDLVPFFPAFAAVAFGIAFAKTVPLDRIRFNRFARPSLTPLERVLTFAGRHSLWVYLLHQPVLIGALWLYLRVVSN